MLISRTACLGKLRHKPRGYSGPLSRHLLSYNSVISSLHASLRDILEMSLVTMFLEGQVSRERDDWMDLSLGYVVFTVDRMCWLILEILLFSSLPLYDEHSCALGIVTKTYLDELSTCENPTSEDTRGVMKEKCQSWVEYCYLLKSLDDSFQLWDAVS